MFSSAMALVAGSAYDSDETFIREFKIEWEARNKARHGGKLGLESLDIASIEGKNRFPDPRNVSLTSYSQEFRRTVIALRNTPGATPPTARCCSRCS